MNYGGTDYCILFGSRCSARSRPLLSAFLLIPSRLRGSPDEISLVTDVCLHDHRANDCDVFSQAASGTPERHE